MVLEGHVVLCVTEPNFLKNFLHRKWGKWAKKRVFWICWKIWALIFSEFSLYRTFILIIVFLHKSHTWEKSGSWDMSQNVLSQSDCRIFKSIISLKQNGERALYFCMLIHVHGNQKLIEKSWGWCDQKWVWPLCSWDSKIGYISRRN